MPRSKKLKKLKPKQQPKNGMEEDESSSTVAPSTSGSSTDDTAGQTTPSSRKSPQLATQAEQLSLPSTDNQLVSCIDTPSSSHANDNPSLTYVNDNSNVLCSNENQSSPSKNPSCRSKDDQASPPSSYSGQPYLNDNPPSPHCNENLPSLSSNDNQPSPSNNSLSPINDNPHYSNDNQSSSTDILTMPNSEENPTLSKSEDDPSSPHSKTTPPNSQTTDELSQKQPTVFDPTPSEAQEPSVFNVNSKDNATQSMQPAEKDRNSYAPVMALQNNAGIAACTPLNCDTECASNPMEDAPKLGEHIAHQAVPEADGSSAPWTRHSPSSISSSTGYIAFRNLPGFSAAVILNRSSKRYMAGESISGYVDLAVGDELPCKRISICSRGICHIKTHLYQTYDPDDSLHENFEESLRLRTSSMQLWPTTLNFDEKDFIEFGHYTFPFSLRVPEDSTPSHREDDGRLCIEYSLMLEIIRSRKSPSLSEKLSAFEVIPSQNTDISIQKAIVIKTEASNPDGTSCIRVEIEVDKPVVHCQNGRFDVVVEAAEIRAKEVRAKIFPILVQRITLPGRRTILQRAIIDFFEQTQYSKMTPVVVCTSRFKFILPNLLPSSINLDSDSEDIRVMYLLMVHVWREEARAPILLVKRNIQVVGPVYMGQLYVSCGNGSSHDDREPIEEGPPSPQDRPARNRVTTQEADSTICGQMGPGPGTMNDETGLPSQRDDVGNEGDQSHHTDQESTQHDPDLGASKTSPSCTDKFLLCDEDAESRKKHYQYLYRQYIISSFSEPHERTFLTSPIWLKTDFFGMYEGRSEIDSFFFRIRGRDTLVKMALPEMIETMKELIFMYPEACSHPQIQDDQHQENCFHIDKDLSMVLDKIAHEVSRKRISEKNCPDGGRKIRKAKKERPVVKDGLCHKHIKNDSLKRINGDRLIHRRVYMENLTCLNFGIKRKKGESAHVCRYPCVSRRYGGQKVPIFEPMKKFECSSPFVSLGNSNSLVESCVANVGENVKETGASTYTNIENTCHTSDPNVCKAVEKKLEKEVKIRGAKVEFRNEQANSQTPRETLGIQNDKGPITNIQHSILRCNIEQHGACINTQPEAETPCLYQKFEGKEQCRQYSDEPKDDCRDGKKKQRKHDDNDGFNEDLEHEIRADNVDNPQRLSVESDATHVVNTTSVENKPSEYAGTNSFDNPQSLSVENTASGGNKPSKDISTKSFDNPQRLSVEDDTTSGGNKPSEDIGTNSFGNPQSLSVENDATSMENKPSEDIGTNSFDNPQSLSVENDATSMENKPSEDIGTNSFDNPQSLSVENDTTSGGNKPSEDTRTNSFDNPESLPAENDTTSGGNKPSEDIRINSFDNPQSLSVENDTTSGGNKPSEDTRTNSFGNPQSLSVENDTTSGGNKPSEDTRTNSFGNPQSLSVENDTTSVENRPSEDIGTNSFDNPQSLSVENDTAPGGNKPSEDTRTNSCDNSQSLTVDSDTTSGENTPPEDRANSFDNPQSSTADRDITAVGNLAPSDGIPANSFENSQSWSVDRDTAFALATASDHNDMEKEGFKIVKQEKVSENIPRVQVTEVKWKDGKEPLENGYECSKDMNDESHQTNCNMPLFVDQTGCSRETTKTCNIIYTVSELSEIDIEIEKHEGVSQSHLHISKVQEQIVPFEENISMHVGEKPECDNTLHSHSPISRNTLCREVNQIEAKSMVVIPPLADLQDNETETAQYYIPPSLQPPEVTTLPARQPLPKLLLQPPMSDNSTEPDLNEPMLHVDCIVANQNATDKTNGGTSARMLEGVSLQGHNIEITAQRTDGLVPKEVKKTKQRKPKIADRFCKPSVIRRRRRSSEGDPDPPCNPKPAEKQFSTLRKPPSPVKTSRQTGGKNTQGRCRERGASGKHNGHALPTGVDYDEENEYILGVERNINEMTRSLQQEASYESKNVPEKSESDDKQLYLQGNNENTMGIERGASIPTTVSTDKNVGIAHANDRHTEHQSEVVKQPVSLKSNSQSSSDIISCHSNTEESHSQVEEHCNKGRCEYAQEQREDYLKTAELVQWDTDIKVNDHSQMNYDNKNDEAAESNVEYNAQTEANSFLVRDLQPQILVANSKQYSEMDEGDRFRLKTLFEGSTYCDSKHDNAPISPMLNDNSSSNSTTKDKCLFAGLHGADGGYFKECCWHMKQLFDNWTFEGQPDLWEIPSMNNTESRGETTLDGRETHLLHSVGDCVKTERVNLNRPSSQTFAPSNAISKPIPSSFSHMNLEESVLVGHDEIYKTRYNRHFSTRRQYQYKTSFEGATSDGKSHTEAYRPTVPTLTDTIWPSHKNASNDNDSKTVIVDGMSNLINSCLQFTSENQLIFTPDPVSPPVPEENHVHTVVPKPKPKPNPFIATRKRNLQRRIDGTLIADAHHETPTECKLCQNSDNIPDRCPPSLFNGNANHYKAFSTKNTIASIRNSNQTSIPDSTGSFGQNTKLKSKESVKQKAMLIRNDSATNDGHSVGKDKSFNSKYVKNIRYTSAPDGRLGQHRREPAIPRKEREICQRIVDTDEYNSFQEKRRCYTKMIADLERQLEYLWKDDKFERLKMLQEEVILIDKELKKICEENNFEAPFCPTNSRCRDDGNVSAPEFHQSSAGRKTNLENACAIKHQRHRRSPDTDRSVDQLINQIYRGIRRSGSNSADNGKTPSASRIANHGDKQQNRFPLKQPLQRKPYR